ncbi:hypothetical protein PgNI_10793, partial [Pyricularia grisea]|uniref:Uncharacterized protein n=1 Tax=Pyricularia grisea TaxID=148305 RepID=A0A6P8AY46_PYRGI
FPSHTYHFSHRIRTSLDSGERHRLSRQKSVLLIFETGTYMARGKVTRASLRARVHLRHQTTRSLPQAHII